MHSPVFAGEKTLSLDMDYFPDVLDPAANMTNTGWYLLNTLGTTLFDIGEDQSIRGVIAESWHALDGGQRYRVTIRKDAFFHNGLPITAEDVAFSLRRKQRLWPDYELFDWLDPRSDGALRVLDVHTIEFRLIRPYSYFLFILALPGTGIVPRSLYPADGPLPPETLPVMGGAYRVAEWKKGDFLRLVWFDKWFENRGRRPQTIMVFERGDDDALERFAHGDTQVFFDKRHNLAYSTRLASFRGLLGAHFPAFNTISFAYLNSTSGPFADKELRELFREAVLRFTRSLKLDPQTATVADQFFPEGYSGRTAPYREPTEQPQFDKRFQALRKSPKKVRFLLGSHAVGKSRRPPIADFMKDFGFEIEVVSATGKETKKMRAAGEGFDFGFWQIPIPPGDPCLVFRLDFGKDDFYIPDPNDGKLYKLIKKTAIAGTLEERVALAREINEYINEESFIIPQRFMNMPIYATKDVDLSALPRWDFNVKFSDLRLAGQER